MPAPSSPACFSKARACPRGTSAAVVGFRVNCRSHPDDLAYPATDLVAAGDPSAGPDEILGELALAMAEHLSAVWMVGKRFDAIRAAWLALAVDRGTRLAVALPKGQAIGTFEGLDADGRLLLKTGDGPTRIDAGDVFLGEVTDRV